MVYACACCNAIVMTYSQNRCQMGHPGGGEHGGTMSYNREGWGKKLVVGK